MPKVSRRTFLGSSGLALLSTGLKGYPNSLFAGKSLSNKTLVTIFLRGGMDGLTAVTPLDGSDLKEYRPSLIVTESKFELDDFYFLHPAFGKLYSLYNAGELAVVHGVGSKICSRSHLDAQKYVETGEFGEAPSGWLNRILSFSPQSHSFLQGISVSSFFPYSFRGEQFAISVSDTEKLIKSIHNHGITSGEISENVSLNSNSTFEKPLREVIKSFQVIPKEAFEVSDTVNYPDSTLGNDLSFLAQIIKARVGLRVAFCESKGWDTHKNQGAASGVFAQKARDLASAISAFWKELGSIKEDVVVVTMTEFGRSIKENEAGGTNHGMASCMFIIGKNIEGGRVFGKVPVLDSETVENSADLPVTTDVKAVLCEIIEGHLGISDYSHIFPEVNSYQPLGMFPRLWTQSN